MFSFLSLTHSGTRNECAACIGRHITTIPGPSLITEPGLNTKIKRAGRCWNFKYILSPTKVWNTEGNWVLMIRNGSFLDQLSCFGYKQYLTT